MSQATIKSCLNCQEEFIPKSAKALYCSERCKKAYQRNKDKPQAQADIIEEKVQQSPGYQARKLSEAPTDKVERLKWFKEQALKA